MFECQICAEEYETSEVVVSTTCGHVFHQNCLQEWINRSGNCPQCRSANPGHHKIFLGFDEATRRLQELEESLKEKTQQLSSAHESHALELSALQDKLVCNEKICSELREKIEILGAQHDSIEQQNILKATEIHDMEVQLAHKTTLNEELQSMLEERDSQIELQTKEINSLIEFGSERVQALTEECRLNTEKCAQAKKECTELKQKLSEEVEAREMLLERNCTLEQKLKQIQLELQKEIRHTTELTVDRMRMESMMEKTTTKYNKDAMNELASNRDIKKDVAEKMEKRSIYNSISITGLRGNCSPRETVLKIAQQMQLCVGDDDIEDAVVDRHSNLVVGFKSCVLKDLFLHHADKLKNFPETQHFEIRALGARNDLLAYAQKLKSVGYKKLYTKNNVVFVSRDKNSTPLKILNKECVDKMMELSTIGTKQPNAPKPHQKSAQAPTTLTHQKAAGPNTSGASAVNTQWKAPFPVTDARTARLVDTEAPKTFSDQNGKLDHPSSTSQRVRPNVQKTDLNCDADFYALY